jgi:hypothetical protein
MADALSESFPTSTVEFRSRDEMEMLGGAPVVSVNFRVDRQVQNNWCWAAVSSSIANFFSAGSWTQCGVASAEMGGQCCQYGNSWQCDQPHFLDRALARVGHFNSVGPVAPAPQVQAELGAGRPVAIRVGWNNGAPNGGGHFLAISGITPYGPVDAIIEVTDPIFAVSTILGSALAGGGYQQGGGRWTHSYFVR